MKQSKESTGMLPFPRMNWGGRRKGAGRKPKGDKAGVSHRSRAALAARFPVHVTTRLMRGLPSLRSQGVYAVLRAAFAMGCDRNGFRLVHYSVQGNHLHMIVEATDRTCLSRGLQGLLVRIARALNRLWRRAGKVFADRYHDHILRTPREVRHALAYVLNNARRHGVRLAQEIDYFTSGCWFDGWRENLTSKQPSGLARPVARARNWLLNIGWRRHGLISHRETPG
ncbi:MAG: transposase [Planctomycetes bacterium]|nr:transposase [Planctomycetota bacterium]MCB9888561.1 transposase [Planctomycetota bacterium]